MLGGKMVIEKRRFTDKKREGRPKVLNKTAKVALNKAMYKTENPARQILQQLAS